MIITSPHRTPAQKAAFREQYERQHGPIGTAMSGRRAPAAKPRVQRSAEAVARVRALRPPAPTPTRAERSAAAVQAARAALYESKRQQAFRERKWISNRRLSKMLR